MEYGLDGYEVGEMDGRDAELGLGPYAADVLDLVDYIVHSGCPSAFCELLRQ